MLLGTWNLENLYRPGGAFGPRTEAAYKAKLTTLAGVIRELDPTLLGVQEVGDPAALEDLAGMLDGDWHIVLSAHPDSRGIRVGFLSRPAPRTIIDTNEFPAPLRPVQGDDDGEPVSRYGPRSPGGGGGAARHGRHPVGGGLPSEVEAADVPGRPVPATERGRTGPLRRVRPVPAGRRGHRSACRRRQSPRRRGHNAGRGRARRPQRRGHRRDDTDPAGPARLRDRHSRLRPARQGDAARLWNIAPLIPEKQRFSRVHSGRPELIDHILVSHRLLDRVTGAGTGAPLQEAPLPSVDEDPNARRDATGSDHAPVWARIAP